MTPSQQLSVELTTARTRLDTLKRAFSISNLAELSFEPSRQYSKSQLRAVTELLHSCHLIRDSHQDFHRLDGWTDEEFLRELPRQYRDLYEKQLLPAEGCLLRFHLDAFVTSLRKSVDDVESVIGPLSSVISPAEHGTELDRATVYVLLGRMRFPRGELGNLREDFSDLPDFVDWQGTELGQWLSRFLKEWSAIESFRSDIRADDGRQISMTLVGFPGSKSSLLRLAEDRLIAENRAVPAFGMELYADLKFDEVTNDLLAPRSGTDWREVRGILWNAIDYYRQNVPDLIVDGDDDDLEGREASTREPIDRLLSHDGVWQFLGQVSFDGTRFEEWIENLQALRPIVTGAGRLNFDKRQLVYELFNSLIVGNYLAFFALCRAVCERLIKDKADSEKIDLCWPVLSNGKPRRKSFEDLIDEVAAKCAAVTPYRQWLHDVREKGNDVLHESKKNKGGVGERATLRRAQQIAARQDLHKLIEFIGSV